MKNVEIEIQVNIEKSKVLLDFLEKNAEFKSERHQLDKYFSPAHRNFLEPRPMHEWLRLRDSGGNYSINYKNWHFDDTGRSYHGDEHESEIGNLEQVKSILEALDFKLCVTVDKLRKIWRYMDYEVAVDSVKDLGDFVEIEYKGEDENADPKKTTEEMIGFLKEVGCGKIRRNYVGYPFQLLFPKEVKYEEQ